MAAAVEDLVLAITVSSTGTLATAVGQAQAGLPDPSTVVAVAEATVDNSTAAAACRVTRAGKLFACLIKVSPAHPLLFLSRQLSGGW